MFTESFTRFVKHTHKFLLRDSLIQYPTFTMLKKTFRIRDYATYSAFSFFLHYQSTVCRGRKRWTTVIDTTSWSRYWRSTRLFDGFYGSVHPIIIYGLHHFSGRKHDSSHHLGCSTELLWKHVRFASHVLRLVIWEFFITQSFKLTSIV